MGVVESRIGEERPGHACSVPAPSSDRGDVLGVPSAPYALGAVSEDIFAIAAAAHIDSAGRAGLDDDD